MYEEYFELRGRPFLPTPQVDRYVRAEVIENARETLSRCIQRGEGPGLLIGPAGIGKTLLCQLLAREFEDTFAVVQLASGRLGTRTALLQSILYELGQPYRAMDEGELRLALVDFLEPSPEGAAGMLLLVDEAHTLPLRLLEEMRLLTNLVRDGQSRVRVVLAGSALLEERFASPKLCSFAQRLAARCYLEPLNATETADYVRSELAAVGGDAATLIDEPALRSVYRATDGIPRLINQVCDHALLLASLGGARQLSSEAIEEAWADLQQLPTPWSAGSGEAPAEGVIEFGELDAPADEAPEAIPFCNTPTPVLHVAETVETVETVEFFDPADERHAAEPYEAYSESEVELEFPEFPDPLNEEFAEEEVVLDRYASVELVFAEAPRVSCRESQQIAAMLEELDVSTAPSQAPDFEPIAFESICPADEARTVDIATEPCSTADVICTPPVGFAIEDESRVESLCDDDESVDSVDYPIAATGGESFWAGAKASSAEGNFIIIEEEPAVIRQPPTKRQYRQLFAKLRRG
jgi:type II secretory pathway predicted ATPase ExeA